MAHLGDFTHREAGTYVRKEISRTSDACHIPSPLATFTLIFIMEGGTETQRQERGAACASVYRVLKVALHPEVGGTVGGVTARPEALDLLRLREWEQQKQETTAEQYSGSGSRSNSSVNREEAEGRHWW